MTAEIPAHAPSHQIKVTHLLRKPAARHFSIERLFRAVAAKFPADIAVSRHVARFESRGFLRRVFIILEAARAKGDVLHVTGDNHFLAFLLPKRRTVLTIHDALTISRLNGIRRWLFVMLWFRLPMSRARIITVVSEETRTRLRSLGLGDQADIRVVPNCNVANYPPHPKPFSVMQPELLLIGTNWNKNLDRVIQSLRGVRCRARIIGNLSEAQIKSLRDQQVEFSVAGRLSDAEVLDEYRRCDALIFASLEEGFGLPILEAQSVGRVVVTSDRSSMPEVAGGGAELVDPTSTESIRGGILRIIHDEAHRKALIERGFENVLRFDASRVAEQYAAIYREIAAGQAPY